MRESRTYGSVRGARDKRASLPLPENAATSPFDPKPTSVLSGIDPEASADAIETGGMEQIGSNHSHVPALFPVENRNTPALGEDGDLQQQN